MFNDMLVSLNENSLAYLKIYDLRDLEKDLKYVTIFLK